VVGVLVFAIPRALVGADRLADFSTLVPGFFFVVIL
jgi:hypothetical protein